MYPFYIANGDIATERTVCLSPYGIRTASCCVPPMRGSVECGGTIVTCRLAIFVCRIFPRDVSLKKLRHRDVGSRPTVVCGRVVGRRKTNTRTNRVDAKSPSRHDRTRAHTSRCRVRRRDAYVCRYGVNVVSGRVTIRCGARRRFCPRRV